MRVVKTFVVRFTWIFALLFISSYLYRGLFSSPSSPHQLPALTVLDRKYQATLASLRDTYTRLPEYWDTVRTVTIHPHNDTTRCLVTGEGKLLLHKCDQSSETKFEVFTSRHQGKMSFVRQGNQCLDMGGVSRDTGTPVITYGCHRGSSQEITFDTTARMFYRSEDNRCLDRTDVGDDGGLVRLVNCNLRLDAQRWTLVDHGEVQEWVEQ